MNWREWPDGRTEIVNGYEFKCIHGRIFEFDGFPMIITCRGGVEDILFVGFCPNPDVRNLLRRILEMKDGLDLVKVFQVQENEYFDAE